MRLTKRQLKRIIREEFSLLKRRGLIRENFNQDTVDQMRLYIDDLMDTADQGLGAYEMDDDRSAGGYQESWDDVEDPAFIQSELRKAFPGASRAEIEEAMGSW